MKPTISITDTTTGISRSYVEQSDWHEALEFLWSEGNYSCDCNRHLFFAWAANSEDEPEVECGETRFKVRITDPTGAVLYADD